MALIAEGAHHMTQVSDTKIHAVQKLFRYPLYQRQILVCFSEGEVVTCMGMHGAQPVKVSLAIQIPSTAYKTLLSFWQLSFSSVEP